MEIEDLCSQRCKLRHSGNVKELILRHLNKHLEKDHDDIAGRLIHKCRNSYNLKGCQSKPDLSPLLSINLIN